MWPQSPPAKLKPKSAAFSLQRKDLVKEPKTIYAPSEAAPVVATLPATSVRSVVQTLMAKILIVEIRTERVVVRGIVKKGRLVVATA